MSALAIFDYSGQTVRTVTVEGEPWFVAADVCAVLDLGNPSQTVSYLDDDERTLITNEGDRPQNVISESGLYSLILRSRKVEAKAFKRWIVREVLPAIRRTGSFGQPVALPSKLQLAQMVIEAETAREIAEARIAELEPRAEVADRLLDADGDLSVGDTAKTLTRAGITVGANRLFTVLSGMKWIYKPADQRWRVYQSAITAGYMSVIPQSHFHPRTGVLVLDPPQPRVTPKGLQRLLADHGGKELVAS